ncbi:4167_t:CDS:2, partial [Scutellospora calospora]
MSYAYSEYIEEFSIEIADFNPISSTIYIPLPETLPKYDGLDLSHYVSAPRIFNDSLYKSSEVELKLITDID